MSQEVARLQELLARVQRNAALPRILNVAAAPALPEPPAYFTPPATVPPSAALDDSVDELLLEDPFPSAPPPPPPSYDELLEEEPIPLMSRSVHQQDISGVTSLSSLSAAETPEELLEDDIVEVTPDSKSMVSASQGRHDELSFGDESLNSEPDSRIEEPPASSSRSRIAGTMDEALARAAEQVDLDEGREVPLKTPPPESGPQEALNLPPVAHAGLPRDIEELLEADILNQGGASSRPTAEQLGQTIDLEEARGPSLELDHPALVTPLPAAATSFDEDLELNLPQREFVGGYQDDLRPPPEAERDLAAHRERFAESDPAPRESSSDYPPQAPGFAPQSAALGAAGAPATVTTDSHSESVSMVTVEATPSAEFAPELLARPVLGPTPSAKFIRKEAPRPNTFLELLDASLGLGRD